MVLVMILSLAAPAFAAGVEEKLCAVVRFEDGADTEMLCARLEALPGISVRWTYEALFRGAAIEGGRSALTAAAECGGIESLYLSRMWAQPYAVGDKAGTSNSLDVMQGENLAYDGDGMVVAVIDSGLYVPHEAFENEDLMKNPALSEENIETFIANGGTDGRYISAKIPFAYDYSEKNRSVQTADNHGTHVAALAVGYSKFADGSSKFRGVAPAAQLLCMKVFPNNPSFGASDADILKAMEDAFLLGADVVNLSLGTEIDFVEGTAIGTLYRTAVTMLREAGVVVCCAAGNGGDALYGKNGDITLPTADYTDYGTACIPAAYPGATAVGAVNTLTREGGGIVVAGNILSYTKCVSENGEEVLPDLDDLADQELTYVMVGGLGAKSDYEGLDLTGCVAVVKRGELYFADKVANAAAAGAVACLIYNNEPGDIRPAVTGTVIPSAIVSQKSGEILAENAENGRGKLTISAEQVMVSTGEPLAVMSASTWGATSGLRLVPTLAAPGGAVYSAIAGERDSYGYLSGTSMATPNASGSFAVLMQALAERGVTDKKARADLAESLLISTAALVTTGDGTPLSPRHQGAGLIDLSAALETSAVITNPILELGDELESVLRLSFTVENLSNENVNFAVDTRVLTDAFAFAEDRAYNTLTPLEVTKYMKISGPKEILVKAGNTQKVQLTITADKSFLAAMDEVFVNGFYLEGFVTLRSESGDEIHATFMGYQGDWEAAPVIEPMDFRDLMNARAAGNVEEDLIDELLGVNMWFNLPYLIGSGLMPGQNPYTEVAAFDERISMAAWDSNAHLSAGYAFQIDLFTLRHAAHVIMVVSDRKTGKIYYVDDTPNLPRAMFGETDGLPVNTGVFFWDGTDSEGNCLADGTEVNVEFYAWTESDTAMQNAYAQTNSSMNAVQSYRWLISGRYDRCKEWEFPLVLDGTAPALSAERNGETGEITLTVSEDQYLAYVKVTDGGGKILIEETFADETRGEEHVLTVQDGSVSGNLYVMLTDYATNTVGYSVDLSALAEGEDGISRCPVAFLDDVKKDAWYHEAVDFVCEDGLVDATGAQQFEPDRGATRAMVIETLYRLAGKPETAEVELPFVDILGNESYLDALKWAYWEGITNGYSEEIFAGFGAISRQQVAVMLYRAAALTGIAEDVDESVLNKFVDGADVAAWAKEALAWAVSEGILRGDNSGRLNPNANTTRAEMAQIVMNYCLNKH